jgi:hypothetical protein
LRISIVFKWLNGGSAISAVFNIIIRHKDEPFNRLPAVCRGIIKTYNKNIYDVLEEPVVSAVLRRQRRVDHMIEDVRKWHATQCRLQNAMGEGLTEG